MKKFILSLTAVAALLTVLFTAVPTSGQSGQPAGAAAQRQVRPHQVGLIDMAFVFNNYEKFKAMQTSLQNEFKAAQEKAKTVVEEVKALSAQLSAGTLKKDSPEYAQIEREIIRKQTELQSYGQIIQREQLKKEAEVYKQIYLEVQDAIRIYADAYGYTLILRFDREAVETAGDPQQILQRMTRQVVYFRGQDDLTNPILTHLNKQYAASAQQAGRPAAAPAMR